MTGLYFYKLNSPYEGDITKDCKLTVNEIDHNFATLKGSDIDAVNFDAEANRLVLTRLNGETLTMDLSSMVDGITTNLDVTYDSIDGVIALTYNGEKVIIDGLITKDNLSKEILTKVYADSSLEGAGTIANPLKIADVEKTGSFKAAKKVINIIEGEKLPSANNLVKGDRYITFEEFSDYGYLYNYTAVKHLNEDLADCGWRVPTKEDWDNMLNAIEPCEYRNHNSLINNNILGKLAGKLLKSADKWMSSSVEDIKCNICGSENCKGDCATYDYTVDKEESLGDTDFDVTIESQPQNPQAKPILTNGVDSYGMSIVPAGLAFNCNPTHYNHFGVKGAYWTSTMMYETDVYSKVFNDSSAGVAQIGEQPSSFLSVRLVKDYDGMNHNSIECINGMNFETVLMPSLNTPTKHTIWTVNNVAFRDARYPMVTPNNGMSVTYTNKYIINEWNGCEWSRKELVEGDSLVLLQGLNGRPNEEYRVINGQLLSVTDVIYKTIIEYVNQDLENIKVKIEAEEARAQKAEKHLEELIQQETQRAETTENKLDILISNEIQRATASEERLGALINQEIQRAQNEEARIDRKLDSAVEDLRAKDDELDGYVMTLISDLQTTNDKLDAEIQRAKTKEGEIDQEIVALKAQDEVLQSNIDAETEQRVAADNQIVNKLINIDGSVHTYECAKGIITLHTNDGTPITIKLDSNYGTF